MKQEYKEALSEVNEIIKLMPNELVDKIPRLFREIIEEERDFNYKPDIKEPLEKCKLKTETIILLGLIYRDFLCPLDEKKMLQEKDARELQKVKQEMENEIREKYNPNNIFNNREIIEKEPIKTNEETRMIVVQEEKWYNKIFNIIKHLFKK